MDRKQLAASIYNPTFPANAGIQIEPIRSHPMNAASWRIIPNRRG